MRAMNASAWLPAMSRAASGVVPACSRSIAAPAPGWRPAWVAARVDFGAWAPHSIDTGNALALPQPGA
jgi:hypothetical protein